MVRYASGLIFVWNCDGHVLEGYGTGIQNLWWTYWTSCMCRYKTILKVFSAYI
jgi:hypothetical protein